jgi:GNAT superfamily N-acetyltransferase
MSPSVPLTLRLARISDVAACAALDASYSAEHTWQLTQDHPRDPDAGEVRVGLRCVRLPRARTVAPPDPTAQLDAEWDATDLFVIAELERIAGYLCVRADADVGWVTRVVVDTPHRRAGIATALLAAARGWAAEVGLRCLLAAAPAKNDPLIRLLRGNGYRIRGYNERHLPNGEVAIYLGLDLQRG